MDNQINPYDDPLTVASALDRISDISGDDEEDIRLLRSMGGQAGRYLESFAWCSVVLDGWLAGGVGGVFAIFLFHIVPSKPDVDEWLWVMIGDLPSVYLAFEDAPSVKDAFLAYVEGMKQWIKYVRSGSGEEPPDVPPIDLPMTLEQADALELRVRSLAKILGPVFA